MNELIEISHPDVDGTGHVVDESLEVWLDLGWSAVKEAPPGEGEEAPTNFVVSIGEDGKETMVEQEEDDSVEPTDEFPAEAHEEAAAEEDEPAAEETTEEETPLPDEKESEQDDTADPKE